MNCRRPMWIEETSDVHGTYVPCGKCYPCMQGRRNVWTFRMMQETKEADSGYFITLTYDDENVPIVDQWGFSVMTLYSGDLSRFFKRLRENILKWTTKEMYVKVSEVTGKESPRLRYFAVGEYGSPIKTERPHYHAIIWNFPDEFVNYDPIHNKLYCELIEDTWKKGMCDIQKVDQGACHYVAKYTIKEMIEWVDQDVREKPFARMSRRPGIGLNYVTDEVKNYFANNKNSFALVEGNYKQQLGRYYREKISDDYGQVLRQEIVQKSRDYAIRKKEDIRKDLRRSYEGDDFEGYILQIERERREADNRKIERIIKKSKL